jgi:hypothetical protein
MLLSSSALVAIFRLIITSRNLHRKRRYPANAMLMYHPEWSTYTNAWYSRHHRSDRYQWENNMLFLREEQLRMMKLPRYRVPIGNNHGACKWPSWIFFVSCLILYWINEMISPIGSSPELNVREWVFRDLRHAKMLLLHGQTAKSSSRQLDRRHVCEICQWGTNEPVWPAGNMEIR